LRSFAALFPTTDRAQPSCSRRERAKVHPAAAGLVQKAMDVGIWLKGLGLENHTEAFIENGVDTALLSELTNEDLKDLGVTRLADRKRLLKAIAGLPGRIARSDTERNEPAASMGERRQITVLFADLSNFTALSSELDAEQTHALLNRYFETVDGIVERYGGTIDKHNGDNVMAVFGAPIAHTDDPRRAVRAALDIHNSMTELSGTLGRELSAHIGIAGGQVVASGTGSDAHREYTVTGDTVNLASRLDDMAAAGETLASEAVWNAVSPIAICNPRGRVSAKGLSREIAVWAVQGPASLANALECRTERGSSPEDIFLPRNHEDHVVTIGGNAVTAPARRS